MRWALVLLAVPAALAAQSAEDTTARPIRLDEAVRLAQQNNVAAVQALGQLQQSQASVRAAYGAFIPALTLSASTSRQGGDRFNPQGQLVQYTGDAWQYNHGLSLNVDLFDGLSRMFNVRASKAQVNAAVANQVAQRYVIAYDVKQQFFAALAARESETAAVAQLSEANEQLAASIARLQAKTVTRSDSLRSVIAVGSAQLALVNARYALQTADAALTRLVGTTYTVTASPDDTLGLQLVTLDSAGLYALAMNGPTVQQAAAVQVASQASAKAARAPYMPTLSASWAITGNGSSTGFQGLADRYAYQNQFRLGISYPLFNQFQREQAIVNADVTLHDADAALRDMRLAAQANFVQYFGALRTAQAQVQIDEVSVAAAEEDLRVQRQRYDYGAALQLDVLTSEAALVQARTALIQARYNYRVAKAQLEALVGKDL